MRRCSTTGPTTALGLCAGLIRPQHQRCLRISASPKGATAHARWVAPEAAVMVALASVTTHLFARLTPGSGSMGSALGNAATTGVQNAFAF
eukprot:SAG31_NODE_2546_length_5531_cov_1.748159_7_plen_91_part_00